MPLRIAADGSAFRPGILWPKMKGPGLKPYRLGLGFRGMNAPAPSKRTNNGTGGRLGWRRLLKNEDATAWKMLRPKGNPAAAKPVSILVCLQEDERVRLQGGGVGTSKSNGPQSDSRRAITCIP
jgi:hypothetical protein